MRELSDEILRKFDEVLADPNYFLWKKIKSSEEYIRRQREYEERIRAIKESERIGQDYNIIVY